MKTALLNSLLTAILSTSLLAACGTEPDASMTSNATSGVVLDGKIKMYKSVGKVTTPDCDIHTMLTLTNGFAGPLATLENFVTGSCKLNVAPMPRSFNLTEVAGDCGSRHYVGQGISVADHRARTCEDIIAAQLIVKETTTSIEEMLFTTTFYSTSL